MKKYWILFLSTFALFSTSLVIHKLYNREIEQVQNVALDSFIQDSKTVKLVSSGKDLKSRVLRKLYTKDRIDTLKLPKVDAKFLKAMENQVVFLKHAHDENFSDLKVEVDHLEEVLEIFRSSKTPEELTAALDAFQICGDGKGNVKFTGYYSPIISARRKQDNNYQHSVYLSEGTKSDRLKVVYVRDREEINSMRMEGAAYLQFAEGDKQLVTFNGDFHTVEAQNEESSHDLTNIEDSKPKLVKATYAVFNEKEMLKPVGAAKVPLTSDYTIAVDEDYIPLGAILLASVPILDAKGNLIRQEFRFVLAQDVGSRIKGAGHVDLYMGEGQPAKERIQNMNKYGKLWLLLPKEKAETKLVAQNL